MNDIITIDSITQFEEVPLRSEEQSEVQYRIKVENFLKLLKQFSKDLLSLVSQLNSFIGFAKSAETETKAARNDAINAKNEAYAYKTEAQLAAEEIKSFVLPNDATYSKDAIDAMFNSILTQVVAQQAQIAILRS